jgi:maleate isomerase
LAVAAQSVVRPPFALDESGGPARIGVVVFDEDITTEDDLWRLRGDAANVAVHVARMPLPLDHSPEGLTRAADDLARAAMSLAPSTRLQALCYSCTTGTLELGFARVAKALARGRPGIPGATPITGAVAALNALGASRIALLTPYPDRLTALIEDYLESEGMSVVRRAVLEVGSEIDFARVSARSLGAAALTAMCGDAQALFISCTALRATPLIPELEAALGVPVLTSTQAMWWEAQTLAGLAPRGIGRIFQSRLSTT